MFEFRREDAELMEQEDVIAIFHHGHPIEAQVFDVPYKTLDPANRMLADFAIDSMEAQKKLDDNLIYMWGRYELIEDLNTEQLEYVWYLGRDGHTLVPISLEDAKLTKDLGFFRLI